MSEKLIHIENNIWEFANEYHERSSKNVESWKIFFLIPKNMHIRNNKIRNIIKLYLYYSRIISLLYSCFKKYVLKFKKNYYFLFYILSRGWYLYEVDEVSSTYLKYFWCSEKDFVEFFVCCCQIILHLWTKWKTLYFIFMLWVLYVDIF